MPATYYVNAAGSNTAPYDTAPKGATSLGYLDAHVTLGNNDTIIQTSDTTEASSNLFSSQTATGVTLQGNSSSSKPTIHFTEAEVTNGININDGWIVQDIIILHDSTSGAEHWCVAPIFVNGPSATIQRCKILCLNNVISSGQLFGICALGIAIANGINILNNVIKVDDTAGPTDGFGIMIANYHLSFQNIKILNNTIIAREGVSVESGGPPGGPNNSNIKIRNNVCYGSSDGIQLASADSITNGNVDNNCNYGYLTPINNTSTGTQVNNITNNPLFTNFSSGDFSLQASSPCKAAGIGHNSDSDIPTVDYNG